MEVKCLYSAAWAIDTEKSQRQETIGLYQAVLERSKEG